MTEAIVNLFWVLLGGINFPIFFKVMAIALLLEPWNMGGDHF